MTRCPCTSVWLRSDCPEHGAAVDEALRALGRKGGKVQTAAAEGILGRSLYTPPAERVNVKGLPDDYDPAAPPETFEDGEEHARRVLWASLGSNDYRERQAAAVKWLEYARGKPGQAKDGDDVDGILYETHAIPHGSNGKGQPVEPLDELAASLA